MGAKPGATSGYDFVGPAGNPAGFIGSAKGDPVAMLNAGDMVISYGLKARVVAGTVGLYIVVDGPILYEVLRVPTDPLWASTIAPAVLSLVQLARPMRAAWALGRIQETTRRRASVIDQDGRPTVWSNHLAGQVAGAIARNATGYAAGTPTNRNEAAERWSGTIEQATRLVIQHSLAAWLADMADLHNLPLSRVRQLAAASLQDAFAAARTAAPTAEPIHRRVEILGDH